MKHIETMTPLLASTKLGRDAGISSVTLWRFERRGLLHPIRIRGRKYYTHDDIQQFMARAKAGEYATLTSGVAMRAHHRRLADKVQRREPIKPVAAQQTPFDMLG